MAGREALHRLIDELREENLPTVTRVLQALHATDDPVTRTLDAARLDDEPDKDDLDGGLTEARADAEAGRGIATEALRRDLGLRELEIRSYSRTRRQIPS